MAVAGCITQGQSELVGRIHHVRFALLWRNVDFRQTCHHCSSLWCSVSFNIYCATNALKVLNFTQNSHTIPKVEILFVPQLPNYAIIEHSIVDSEDDPNIFLCEIFAMQKFFLFCAHSRSIKKENSWINDIQIHVRFRNLGATKSSVMIEF